MCALSNINIARNKRKTIVGIDTSSPLGSALDETLRNITTHLEKNSAPANNLGLEDLQLLVKDLDNLKSELLEFEFLYIKLFSVNDVIPPEFVLIPLSSFLEQLSKSSSLIGLISGLKRVKTLIFSEIIFDMSFENSIITN